MEELETKKYAGIDLGRTSGAMDLYTGVIKKGQNIGTWNYNLRKSQRWALSEIKAKPVISGQTVPLSLIAQGAGWTISRASTILQNKGLMNEILYLPMPEPLLVRKVYVLTRQNEPSALMQEFTQLACSILKESVAPELIKIAPWLEQDIFVLDPTSGVMVDMTGKKAEER